MSARPPTLRLRRAIQVRWLETMAVVRLPVAQAEWPPLLALATELAKQGQTLTPDDVSRRLLPLPVAAARAWLRQAADRGMLQPVGTPAVPAYAPTAHGAAAAKLGGGLEERQGLFRFAVVDDPLLGGCHLLHVEERREPAGGATSPLEADLAHEPGAFTSSVLQPDLPFAVVRTADLARTLPGTLELMLELEVAPDHRGPFRLRLRSVRKEARSEKGEKTAAAIDVRLESPLQRRADQSYADLLALVLAAGEAPRELSDGLSVPFASLPTEARLSFRLRHQKSFPAHLRVAGQFDLGVFDVEPIEVALTPRPEDVDAWGLWLQVRALGGERTPAAAAKAGEAARQKIPSYRPRALHELAAALAQQPGAAPADAGRDALLEAYDLLLWEDAP